MLPTATVAFARTEPDVAVLTVNGSMDPYSAPDIRGVLIDMLNEGRTRQVVDLRGVVLLDPELSTYEPQRAALLEALKWLETETTCGDCLALQCHGADEDECGCARHDASVEARDRARRLRAAGVIPTEGGA